MTSRVYRTWRAQKKRGQDTNAEETTVIVRENDLQLIQEMVSPNRMLEYISEVNQ